jgi:hypothetical protein
VVAGDGLLVDLDVVLGRAADGDAGLVEQVSLPKLAAVDDDEAGVAAGGLEGQPVMRVLSDVLGLIACKRLGVSTSAPGLVLGWLDMVRVYRWVALGAVVGES